MKIFNTQPRSAMAVKLVGLLILLISLFVPEASATTEWWGDLRAQFNPPKFPPFYDVTYDDSEVCPLGVRSMAIPEYVYFGGMLATKQVEKHTDCVLECLITDRCKAVNYFAPLYSRKSKKNETGFCEILGEDQRDNPILMRPFRKAIYYEQIRCITDEEQPSTKDDEWMEEAWDMAPSSSSNKTTLNQTEPNNKPHTPSADNYLSPSANSSDSSSGGAMDAAMESTTVAEKTTSLEVNDDVLSALRNDPQPTEDRGILEPVGPVKLKSLLTNDEARVLASFKKLAASIREFNARFHAQR